MKKNNKLATILLASSLLLPGIAPLASGVASVSAAPATSVQAEETEYKVVTEEVIRFKPAENAKPVALVGRGDTVKLVEDVNLKWFKVEFEGETGYILRGNLTSKKNFENGNNKIHDVNSPKEDGAEKTYRVAVRTALRTADADRYQPLEILKRGDTVEYLGTTANNWFRVKADGVEGYVKREDVTTNKNYEADKKPDLSYGTYTEEATPALDLLEASLTTALRSRPGTQYSAITEVERGTKVTYKGTVKGLDGQWFLVELEDERQGYINRSHVTKVEREVVEELKVESVSAINGKTVKVKFTQPVKKSTVVDGNGKLVATNVSFSTLETPQKTITGALADAELSEDGKTLTITAQTTEVFEGRYQVVIDNVKTTKSEKFPKYDEIINLGKDTTAPAISSVEKINASTSKVTFTEAITNLATTTEVTYSYKLADGTAVPAADVTVTPAADGKSITVSASATKYAGKTITATMLGAKDHVGNLINPNPSTFSFHIGGKDGVVPTVASTKAISPTQIEVNFSEEVQGFATAIAADAGSRVTLTGASGKIASVTAVKIEQDKTDKKKYIVTLSGSALDGATVSAVADLKINKTITLAATGTSTITDLSGEEMATDYSAIVTVTKDTVAPKHVATKVIEEAGEQWLVLEFDEELNTTVATAVAPQAGTATSFKNFVTVSGKNVAFGASLVLTDDGKGIKVKTSDVTFDSVALVDGTKYTFDVVASDKVPNASDAIKVEFTYNGKANSDKPALVTSGAITGNGQDTIVLEFDKELDGASATNAANYKVAGVTVEKAVLAPVDNGTQKVTLTLGKNGQSGDRAITVSGVKSKEGITMDTFNGTVTLKENVKPTVTAAKVIATDKIELTFSENVTLTTANFDVFVGESTTAETVTSTVAGATTDKAIITLNTALTVEQLAKTITVKPASGIIVTDTAGNVLDFKSIVAEK